jgi:predicted deacylase
MSCIHDDVLSIELPYHDDRLFGAIVRFCTRVGILLGTRLADEDEDEDEDVSYFGTRQTLRLVSERASLFVSKVRIAAWLRAGDHIGFIYDAFDGALRAEVKAPRGGCAAGRRCSGSAQ